MLSLFLPVITFAGNFMADSSNEKYKVPAGLRPLLEALARETLRTQPADLITFSQLFFDVLQKHRTRMSALNFACDTCYIKKLITKEKVKYYLSASIANEC